MLAHASVGLDQSVLTASAYAYPLSILCCGCYQVGPLVQCRLMLAQALSEAFMRRCCRNCDSSKEQNVSIKRFLSKPL